MPGRNVLARASKASARRKSSTRLSSAALQMQQDLIGPLPVAKSETCYHPCMTQLLREAATAKATGKPSQILVLAKNCTRCREHADMAIDAATTPRQF